MKIADLYHQVTARIVAELEAGVAPWVKPWRDGRTGAIMPQNAATGRPYSGINVLILWGAREAAGYPTPEWMTFRQAAAKGAVVRKGERGTHVVFTKPLTVREDESDEEKTIRMLKAHVVFNVAQIDGLPVPANEDRPAPPPIEVVDAFIGTTRANIRHGGNRAAYVPSQDFIVLPELRQFGSTAAYYATALHELTHWSGHETRLARDLRNRFGSKAYAAEELVAELGAAFLCAELGVTGRLRHAEYIGEWIGLLRDDDRAVFTAASKASQAAAFLRSVSHPQ